MKHSSFLVGFLLIIISSSFSSELPEEHHGFSLKFENKKIFYLLNDKIISEENIYVDPEIDTQFLFDEDLQEQNFKINDVKLSKIIPQEDGSFDLYIAIKDTRNVIMFGLKKIYFNSSLDFSSPFLLASEMRFFKKEDLLVVDRSEYKNLLIDGSSSASTMSRDSSAQHSPVLGRKLEPCRYNVGVVSGGEEEVILASKEILIASSVQLVGSPNIKRTTTISFPEKFFLRQ